MTLKRNDFQSDRSLEARGRISKDHIFWTLLGLVAIAIAQLNPLQQLKVRDIMPKADLVKAQ